jgi:hypothetical protein
MADQSEPNSEGPGPPEPGGYREPTAARVWFKVRPVVVGASWLAGTTQHQGLAQALGGTAIAVDLAVVVLLRGR